jgi:hypothetical protein
MFFVNKMQYKGELGAGEHEKTFREPPYIADYGIGLNDY